MSAAQKPNFPPFICRIAHHEPAVVALQQVSIAVHFI
jgi:hypothetical protein